MASIRKRGDLQWEARVRKRGYPIQCKTFETKARAEAWARQIESEMDRSRFVSRTEAENTTLFEALARYIDEYIPKLAHSQREANRAQALQRHPLAHRFLAVIRGQDIAKFIKEREQSGVGANTIRLDLALLSRLFGLASTDWGMESLTNPVKKVNKPRLPPGRTRRLEEGEEHKLLSASTELFKQVILFAIETAMRREEIASLTWDKIDFKKSTAHLPKTKNGEARSVPLSPEALEILRNIPRNISGSVFNMTADQITKSMVRITKKTGLENLRFHDFRHEAISRLFENTDLDIMEIKTISGHKCLQMLARYSHLRTHKLAERLAGRKRTG